MSIRGWIGFAADVVGLLLGIISIIAAVAAGAAFAVSEIASGRVSALALDVAKVSGGLLIGVIVGGIVMFLRHRYVARGYRWTNAEYSYTIDAANPQHHVAETRITIKAMRDNVRVFENRYAWSGTGTDPLPTVANGGHVLLAPAVPDANWRHYFVAMRNPLSRGQEATLVLTQHFVDSGNTFQPFYAKTIVEPLLSLKLSVHLPPNTQLASASRTERDSVGPGAKTVAVKDMLPDYQPAVGTLVWDLGRRPRRNHYYRIDWQV